VHQSPPGPAAGGASGAQGRPPPTDRRVLIIIGEDPRTSHRGNEGLRIALGIAAGETPVHIVLLGHAAHLLDEDTDDLVDGDDIARFRASLGGLDAAVHVAAEALPADPTWNPDRLPVTPVTPAGLAALAASAARVLVF
jgi:hypothetical protein